MGGRGVGVGGGKGKESLKSVGTILRPGLKEARREEKKGMQKRKKVRKRRREGKPGRLGRGYPAEAGVLATGPHPVGPRAQLLVRAQGASPWRISGSLCLVAGAEGGAEGL